MDELVQVFAAELTVTGLIFGVPHNGAEGSGGG
jgi:hypothetical protein